MGKQGMKRVWEKKVEKEGKAMDRWGSHKLTVVGSGHFIFFLVIL